MGEQIAPWMDFEDAKRLTFDGRLVMSAVASHGGRSVNFPTLAGARVDVRVPAGWEVQSVSAHVLFNHRGYGASGFQRAPQGSSVLLLLADADTVHPDNLVSMHGGLLAHYSLDWGPHAVAGFTVWQGRWSDVYTFDHVTFDHGVDAFARFAPHDSADGAVLRPPEGASVDKDEVTVDCKTRVLNVFRRDARSVPPWPGARGSHVEMYRLEGQDRNGRVLATSSSAVAIVGRATDHDSLTDAEIAAVAEGLAVQWS